MCLSLVFTTGMAAFGADTFASQQNIQRRVESQIERFNATATKSVTDYKFSDDGTMTIKPCLTKPKLVFSTDNLSDSDLIFYSSMSDDEIYNYLSKVYNKSVQNINNSNIRYKNDLEQQRRTIKQTTRAKAKGKDSDVIIIWPDPITKNRTYTIKPYIDALGYAKLCVYYNVTCYKNRFTNGRVKNCKLEERLSMGSWEYESGYTYPLIETDNGRYIAFQVTGKWTVLGDHGLGAVYEKYYTFNDYNTF